MHSVELQCRKTGRILLKSENRSMLLYGYINPIAQK